MGVGLQVLDVSGNVVYDSDSWRYVRQEDFFVHKSIDTSRYSYYKELVIKYDYTAFDPKKSMLFDPNGNNIHRGNGSAGTLTTTASFFGLNLTVAQAIARVKPLLLLGF